MEEKNDKAEDLDSSTTKINVIVKTQKETQTLLVSENCSIHKFKEIIAPKFNANVEHLLLIFAGKVMKDNLSLKQQNVKEGFTIHLVIKVNQPRSNDQENLQGRQPSSSFSGLDQNSLFGMGGFANSPLLRSIPFDESTVRMILTQIPEFQSLIEANPELNTLVNSPGHIRQIINTMANPSLMQEVVRQQDRALNNIESLPGGSRMLEQMFRNFQEPMMTAMEESLGPNRYATEATAQENSGVENGQRGTENRDALPNPWSQSSGSAGNLRTSSTPQDDVPLSDVDDTAFINLIQRILSGSDQEQSVNDNPTQDPNYATETDRLTELMSRIGEAVQRSDSIYEEQYREQLEQIASMGFENREHNVRALILSSGDVAVAVDILLSGSFERM